MHAINYLRKSREEVQYEKSTGEDVLQIHRERLNALCESKGITFVERSEVVSGDTIANRPKFRQILEVDIPSGQFDCIVVTEISRLGRGDMEDAGRIYKTLITYNIKIVTPSRVYDPGNSSDLRQLRFELFLSREEYEGIKERLWNNRNYRATQGYAGNYIVTLGFRQFRGNVEVIPEEAALVREIFNMRVEGYSFEDIAIYFNSRGLKTKRGTVYHQTTISKITHNPRYIGIARWQGKEYQAKHPAIIDQELWDKVQAVNEDRRHTRRSTKEDTPYLVELYCHECGKRMYGERTGPRRTLANGTVAMYSGRDIYVCVGKRQKPKCTHQIHANIVHDKVLEELNKIVNNPRVFTQLSKERDSRLGINTDALDEQLNDLSQQIKQKSHFLGKLESDYEKGELTALLYSRHTEKTEKEIAALENRIKKLKSELLKSNIKISPPDELRTLLKKFLAHWESYPNKNRSIVIQSFLPRIEVDKQGSFYIGTSLPAILQI